MAIENPVTLISVVLPVFNGEEFLRQAALSILGQSHQDIELVIVDDASTDESSSVIDSLSDVRIRKLRNSTNLGLSATLRIGVEAASGQIIARQDQDDYSDKSRLEKQLRFLNQRPTIGVVGTWAAILAQDPRRGWFVRGHHRHPSDESILRWRLLWNNPFVHSSMMFRRSIYDLVGGYTVDRNLPEDYDLWSRMSRVTGLSNIPEVLQFYRETQTGISRREKQLISNGVLTIASRNLAEIIGFSEESLSVVDLASALNGGPVVQPGAVAVVRRLNLLSLAAKATPRFSGARSELELKRTQLRVVTRPLKRRILPHSDAF